MEVKNIPIEKIVEPKEELRTVIEKEALEELADSISRIGILEPLIVRPSRGKFEIVAGHRRYLAAKMANLKTLPCCIKELSDKEVLIERVHENLKREELNPVDQAALIFKLRTEEGLTQKQIAEIFGKSEGWVFDTERVHYCDEEIKEAIRAGHIKKSHAYVLMKHRIKERRLYFLKLCIENGASPKTLDLWIRDDLGTLERAPVAQPVQKISDLRPEVHKVMLRCALCDEMVPSDAIYVIHVCKNCYDTLWEEKEKQKWEHIPKDTTEKD